MRLVLRPRQRQPRVEHRGRPGQIVSRHADESQRAGRQDAPARIVGILGGRERLPGDRVGLVDLAGLRQAQGEPDPDQDGRHGRQVEVLALEVAVERLESPPEVLHGLPVLAPRVVDLALPEPRGHLEREVAVVVEDHQLQLGALQRLLVVTGPPGRSLQHRVVRPGRRAEVDQALVPHLAPHGVVGQAVAPLGEPVRVEGLDGRPRSARGAPAAARAGGRRRPPRG